MEKMEESVFQTLEQIKNNWPEYWEKIVPEVLMFSRVEEQLAKTVYLETDRCGMRRGDFDVLFRLWAYGMDNLQTPTELYTSLGLTSGGLTKILHRLKAKGMIARKKNPADRRSTMVQLTPKGEARLCDVLDGIIERDRQFFAVLNGKERELLQHLFKKLLKGAGLEEEGR